MSLMSMFSTPIQVSETAMSGITTNCSVTYTVRSIVAYTKTPTSKQKAATDHSVVLVKKAFKYIT